MPTPISSTLNENNQQGRKKLTDVGSLDHADIVTTISDTADTFFRVASDQTSDVCFLRGRASTGNDRR